jgi:putative ABC transport system substrate-binding protein
MRRREFITLLGGAVAWPLAASAQQADRVPRIGVLWATVEDSPQANARLLVFRQTLERLGWSEGQNLRIDTRFAIASEASAQVLAKELVAFQPEVLLAYSTPMVLALQRETRTIPILFVGVSDPIGSGFIASLARPGGNLTGFLLYEASITGKWLAMLKEIAPNVARVALVANPKTTPYEYFMRAAEAAAQSLALELVRAQVENAVDLERAIDAVARVPNGGLVLPPDSTTSLLRDIIVARAISHRLPTVYGSREAVIVGGLMSYSVDRVETLRQAASYADRILRGEKPANLPVQAPTKYETVINLKTAKALGLTVPDKLLVAADEVIE